MSRKIRYLLVGILFALVATAVTWSLWRAGTLNYKYDWGWSLYDWQRSFKQAFFASDDGLLGTAVFLNPTWLVAGTLSVVGTAVGLTVDLALKSWLWLGIFGAGTGLAALLRRRGLSWPVAIIAGLIYACSPTLFIRFIVGFVFFVLAYALTPWWLLLWWELPRTRHPRRVAVGAALLYVVILSQHQYAVMLLLIMVLDLILGTKDAVARQRRLRAVAIALLLAIITQAPWLYLTLRGGLGQVGAVGAASSSLGQIASLPHSLWRTLLGADHHITFPIFDQLFASRTFIIGGFSLLIAALAGGLTKRREPVLMLIILGLTWPLALGPQIPSSTLFSTIYAHLPGMNFFREVYHWAGLTALALPIAAAFGWQWLAARRSGRWLWWLLAILALGLTRPFWNGSFFGYLAPHQINSAYRELKVKTDQSGGRTFFLPALGFNKEAADQTPGAMNSDILAISTNRRLVPQQSSVLDLPSAGGSLRDALLSTWYQPAAAGQSATGYLRALAVQEVITRPKLLSSFMSAFALPPSDGPLIDRWSRHDYDQLVGSDPALKTMVSNEYWTKYQVQSPTSLISLATNPATAAFDWQALNGRADAVFYREDGLPETTERLPRLANDEDWLAAGWPQYSYLPQISVDAAPAADKGWARPAAVWWRHHALATARESYIFTNIPQTLNGQWSLAAGQYDVRLKLWTGAKAGTVDLSLGDWRQTFQTQGEGDGHWRWFTIPFETGGGEISWRVSATGEAGLAQLLIIPRSEVDRAVSQLGSPPNLEKAPQGRVTIKNQSPTRYQVQITTDREAWVIAHINYDDGWVLRLDDGQTYRPARVDGYAMAFRVPGGTYEGELVFRPQLVYRGLQIVAWLTIIALALIIAGLRLPRRLRDLPIDLTGKPKQ